MLIFVKRVEYVSTFLVLYVICNTFPELFVEETIFSLLYCLYFVKFPLTMSESHSSMSDSLQPHGQYTPRSSVHGDTQGKDTRGDCRTLFHRIFLTQGSNPGLLNCRKTFYQLSHQGSPLTFIDYKWAYFWVLYFVPMICLLFFANTALYWLLLLFSHSVVSDSLRPHGLQNTRLCCPSLSPSLLKLMSIESVMPSNHFILGPPLLLLL